jgi:prevent-host-death family protein
MKMTISIGVRDTRQNMADIIGNVFYGNQRYIIERKGKPVAAVISIEDYKFLERVEDMIDSKFLREAVESSEGIFPIEELFAERQRVISEEKNDV